MSRPTSDRMTPPRVRRIGSGALRLYSKCVEVALEEYGGVSNIQSSPNILDLCFLMLTAFNLAYDFLYKDCSLGQNDTELYGFSSYVGKLHYRLHYNGIAFCI